MQLCCLVLEGGIPFKISYFHKLHDFHSVSLGFSLKQVFWSHSIGSEQTQNPDVHPYMINEIRK